MKTLLKHIHGYLRRKLKELRPRFISITVWVPGDVHRDLADEFGSESFGGKSVVSFTEGNWPDETVLNFAPEEE